MSNLSGSLFFIFQIGESGKTTRELEKTVALLKKVVERTQAENEHLKSSMLTPDHLQAIQAENQGLKVRVVCNIIHIKFFSDHNYS